MRNCPHDVFATHTNIYRVKFPGRTDLVGEMAVRCNQCQEHFRWVGVDTGYRGDAPSVSLDGLVLIAPMVIDDD